MLHLEVPCVHPLQPVHHSIRIVRLGSTDSIRQRVEQIETGNTDRKLVKIVLKVTSILNRILAEKRKTEE